MNISIASLWVLSCIFAVTAKEGVPRTYIPEEENPLGQSFVIFKDEYGAYHVEYIGIGRHECKAPIKDLTFYLYTQMNQNDPNIIPAENFDAITKSQFLSSRRNVFIAHGWKNDFRSGVNQVVGEAIIRNYDVNLFIIDWSKAAKLNYVSARCAVPVIGGMVGDFINRLMDTYKLRPTQFDLIGHSLGAHVIGIAGKKVEGVVNSVVGLDPARPLFTISDIDNRIHANDGDHVQIIHTSCGVLGFCSSIGNSDYFPNRGKNQPGCGCEVFGSCSHSRAYYFYAESVESSGFAARRCKTNFAYLAGLCDSNHKAFMGQLNIDKSARGDYHLVTNSKSPFARG